MIFVIDSQILKSSVNSNLNSVMFKGSSLYYFSVDCKTNRHVLNILC